MPKGTGLKWIPINDFNLIPRSLIEQVEPLDFDVDDLYKIGPLIVQNPLTMLGVFTDKKPLIKGYMWAAINPLTRMINVQHLCVDEDCRGMGIIGEAWNLLKKIQEKHGLKGITFSTATPEKFERWGFKKRDLTIMES